MHAVAAEKNADNLRRELNDSKRQLNECCIEKDKYMKSNKELRDFVKKSEAEKREQARSLEEAHQKISSNELNYKLKTGVLLVAPQLF